MAAGNDRTGTVPADRIVHRDKPLPLEYLRKRWLQAVLVLGFFFLYFPIVALMATSFNDRQTQHHLEGIHLRLVRQGLSTMRRCSDALMNSLTVAFTSTVVSTHHRRACSAWRCTATASRRRRSFESTVFLPIVIPEISHGRGHARLFRARPAHLPLGSRSRSPSATSPSAFPFVAVVVVTRMAGFDESLEEASRDLGASAWQTFWNVTVPYMMPGVIAGALAGLHAVAGRFRHHPVHLRPGLDDLARSRSIRWSGSA